MGLHEWAILDTTESRVCCRLLERHGDSEPVAHALACRSLAAPARDPEFSKMSKKQRSELRCDCVPPVWMRDRWWFIECSCRSRFGGPGSTQNEKNTLAIEQWTVAQEETAGKLVSFGSLLGGGRPASQYPPPARPATFPCLDMWTCHVVRASPFSDAAVGDAEADCWARLDEAVTTLPTGECEVVLWRLQRAPFGSFVSLTLPPDGLGRAAVAASVCVCVNVCVCVCLCVCACVCVLVLVLVRALGSALTENKKQCARQLQCEVPCARNVVDSSLSSLYSLQAGGGSGRGGV